MPARNCFKRNKVSSHPLAKMSFRPRLEILEDRTIPSVANVWSALATSDHNWNTGSNWSQGHAPALGEIATFNSSSLENCTINSGVNRCDGISITSLYTGTITASADLSLVTTAGYTQGGGTFNLSSFTIHDTGDWIRSGPAAGTFNAGTGTIEFNSPAGIQTLDNGTSSLFNVLHSGAGTLELLNNALNVNGSLTTNAGTVDAFGQNITIAGLTTITDSTFTNSASADTLTLGGGLSMTGGKLSSGFGKAVLNIGGNLSAVSDATSAATIGGTLVLMDSQQPFNINRGPQTTDLTIAATITDAGPGMHGGFRKLGIGILALTTTNTYTGGTIIDVGTVMVSADGALGPGTASTTVGSLLVLSGGVNYTTPETVSIRGGTLASEAGTVDTFAGPIVLNFSSVVGIQANSGSTLHLMGSAISMQGFTLTVGGAGNVIIDDILSGGLSTASLSKIDSGMLTLNANNSYGGGTTVMGGTLAIGNDGAIGSGMLSMGDGTTLQAAGGSHTLANNITLTGAVTIAGTNSLALNGTIGGATGSLIQTDIGTLLLGGANSFGGGVTVNAGILALGTDTAAGTGPLAFNNNVSILPVNSARTLANPVSLGASANLTVTGTFDLTFNGIISGPGAIKHTSSNVLTLNGANSFGGGITMTAGTLSVGSNTALGTGTFVLNDGTTIQAVGGARTLSNNATFINRVTVTGSNNLTLTGVIGSSGAMQQLTKVGSSTATLSGNNPSLADTIFVNAGSLYVNGQQPNTPINVAPGAVFGGSGTVGAITVNRGTLSPGTPSGPGTLSSGNVQFLNTGCTFSIQIAGPAAGSGYSQLNVTGTVGLGTVNVSLSLSGAYVPQPGNTFEIIANDGSDPITGVFVGLPDGSSVAFNGVNMTIHYSGGDGNDLTLTVPPAKSSIVGRSSASGQWWVGASTGSAFSNSLWDTWSTGVTWVDVQTGDFNGDGHADLVGRSLQDGTWWIALSNGSNGFTNIRWATWSTGVTWVDVKVADFNGDGKADITGRALETGQWWTTLTNGSTFTTGLWASWSTNATWVDVKVGDFNGDGKADITGRYQQGGSWWTGISTGSTFNTSMWATWSTAATWVDVNVGDFDGDGRADIVGRYLEGGSWWTAISTGSSFTTTQWAAWSTSATWVDVRVGDFNGDGKADITGRYLEGGSWWTAISTGSSFTTTKWDAWSTSATWVDVRVGDFNGDGKADITARYKEGGSWWTAISTGSSFTTTKWDAWSTSATWVDVQSGRYL